jgi:phosphonate transport system permease protein
VFAVAGRSVVLTVAFAVLGVALGAVAGLLLALAFGRLGAVRALAAALRSVHELFWALLLIQVTGISPLTGMLAIAIPYAGVFAKVFAEIIEEADLAADRVLPAGTGAVSRFAYARLPVLAGPFGTYLLYRLECGMRSTLVLGFVGLPTMGFELESYFRQGRYAEAAAFVAVFYLLIGTRRLWVRPSTLPVLLAGSVLALAWLTEPLAGDSLWQNLARFLGHDIVPRPLRGADLGAFGTWAGFLGWLSPILRDQVLPGLVSTLVLSQIALVASGASGAAALPARLPQLRRPHRPAARARGAGGAALHPRIHARLRPAANARALHAAGGDRARAAQRGHHRLPPRPPRRRAALPAGRAARPRPLRLRDGAAPYGQFLAYALYRWEIIVRESAIFGILGVMTLGYHIDAAIAELRLDTTLVLIVATGALSMGIDGLSRRLRRRLRVEDRPVRLSAAGAEDRDARACA